MAIDGGQFRQVMGHFATGVTIITTHGGDGLAQGLTANAFSSVSLEPPLCLVCIAKSAESWPAFPRSGVFTVNFLSSSQESLSRRFAKSGGDKFEGVGYRIGGNGCVILDDALAHLECTIAQSVDAGDHTVHLGRVDALAMDQEAEPLLYFRGGYRNVRA